jgi:hypothetical protein
MKSVAKETVVQYFTSLGKEYYGEGMLALVKRWDNYRNSNSIYVE